MFLRISTLFLLSFITLFQGTISTPHAHKFSEKEILPDNTVQNHKHYGDHKHDFDHESILGSHSAAEEFDQLSPEESKKRLKVLALKMDRNHDGHVDHKELTEWVLRSFKMLTEEEALDQLEDEDGDNDGKVTWQEHIAEAYGIYEDDTLDEEERKSSEEYKMLLSDKELFEAADQNKDGVLDKTEYSSFSHPEEFEHMHQIVYGIAMQKRDRNNDGYLSFQEFVADNDGTPPNPASEQYIIEKDRFDHDYDQDKDGKLNREEVLLWLIPNNFEMAETEADHLISSSDEDKNGQLSIDEIVNHYDIFVGSEATDFGEHLQNTQRFTDEL